MEPESSLPYSQAPATCPCRIISTVKRIGIEGFCVLDTCTEVQFVCSFLLVSTESFLVSLFLFAYYFKACQFLYTPRLIFEVFNNVFLNLQSMEDWLLGGVGRWSRSLLAELL